MERGTGSFNFCIHVLCYGACTNVLFCNNYVKEPVKQVAVFCMYARADSIVYMF